MAKTDWHHLYCTKRWQALRTHQLCIEPLCRMCKQVERITSATVVDHKQPHKGNVELFFDASNLQSLCKTCHDVAKSRQEHRGYVQGCDANGIPFARRLGAVH